MIKIKIYLLILGFFKKIKRQQNTPAGQILYRTLYLLIYRQGQIYLDREIIIKKKDLIAFLKGQDVWHGSSECLPALD